jgi:hypothetical protein
MTTFSHRSHTPRRSIAGTAVTAHPRCVLQAAMDSTGATASGGMAVAHRHHEAG